MSGVNLFETQDYRFNKSRYSTVPCVFLSHKSEDKPYVKAVGDYIMSFGINIYLDINDENLQQAVSHNDDVGIVQYIEEGLNASTHLLCIISEVTKYSRWIPYEIGYAKKHFQTKGNSGRIASLFKNDVSSIPTFLEIEKTFYYRRDLLEWLPLQNGYNPNELIQMGLILNDYVPYQPK